MTHNFIAGHHYVFNYIDINEIWISDQISEAEREKVILHEVIERNLMSKVMSYNLAHIEALKSEGDVTEAEIKQREYISPQETRMQFSKIYPIGEKENTWQLGDKVIKFDTHAGIIYLYDGEKIIDQVLVRSSSDIEKFVNKYK